jgi:hypothetical protein
VRSIGFPELVVMAIAIVIIVIVVRTMKNGGAVGFATFGAVVGAVLGFLFRPSLPLVGQLPLGVVLTRGASLNGLDLLFRASAEQSFNYLMIGAILGAVAMAGAKVMVSQGPSPSVAATPSSTLPPSVPTSSPIALPVNAFCTKCGAAFGQDVAFCGSCGTRRG